MSIQLYHFENDVPVLSTYEYIENDKESPDVIIHNNTTGFDNDVDGFHFGLDSNNNGLINHREDTDILFLTNNNEKMRLKNNGNLGINTSAPSEKLDVVGNINLTGKFKTGGNFGTAGQVLKVNSGESGLEYATLTGNASQWTTTGDHIYYNDGKVGINNSNPSEKLDVVGNIKTNSDLLLDTTSKIKINNSFGTAGQILKVNSAESGFEFGTFSGSASQWTSTGDHIYYNTGQVGINNSNPVEKLDVDGNINLTGKIKTSGNFGTAGQVLKVNSGGTALEYGTFSGSASQWTTSNDNIYYSTGNVGVGINNPSVSLDVSGDLKMRNGILDILYNIGYGDNIGIGEFSLYNLGNGYDNIAIGKASLADNTNGSFNLAIGHNSIKKNIDGQGNLGLGKNVLYNNTTGDDNVALGKDALYNNTTGSYNVGLGVASLYSTNYSYNTALGHESLKDTTGGSNVAIGAYAGKGGVNSASNRLYIQNAVGTSNLLIYGEFNNKRVAISKTSVSDTLDVNGSITCIGLQNNSDSRIKINIKNENIESIYDKFKNLNLKNYYYDENYLKSTNQQQKNVSGLIAQEVKAIFPDIIDVGPYEIKYTTKQAVLDDDNNIIEEEEFYKHTYQDFHKINLNKLVMKILGLCLSLQDKVELLEDENIRLESNQLSLETRISTMENVIDNLIVTLESNNLV